MNVITDAELAALAKACGFDHACPMNPDQLVFMPEVRAMCAADKCHSYNKRWSCPPAVGTLEEIRERCSHYHRGLLVQTVGQRSDAFDFLAIMEAKEKHSGSFDRLLDEMRTRFCDLFPMGTGSCDRCDDCTWPDAPCRYPQYVYPPMEALGLMVSDVCRDNGMGYYYGTNSVSFTSCFLF